MPLPTDVDTTYADDPARPGTKAHQIAHDALHAFFNLFEGYTPDDFGGTGGGGAVNSVNGRDGDVTGLAEEADLDDERDARLAADAAEAVARAAADTAEAAARTAADTTEAADRAAGDALLIPLTQRGAANGVATLDAGQKIPAVQLPSIAISDFLGNVANQAAMLALVGQRGDWCNRIDLSQSLILVADDALVLANWQALSTPADLVSSVNARTGAVTGLAEQTALDAEAAIRAAADAAEATARAAGDTGHQPANANLTTIAGLDPLTAGVLASDGAGWVRKSYAAIKAALGLGKGDVGLGNVDNTSDASKPISTAAAAALAAKADLVGGLVPSAQLPSFVDDVVEAANFAALPAVGEAGKIYVTLDNGLTYRWSGSAYVEISASLALGETSATAYRGDRGKTAYDHSQIIAGNPHGVTKADVGLANATNTSDANKPVSTAQQAALDLKAPAAAPYVTLAADATLTGESVLGTSVIMRGAFGAIPPAGIPGRLYVTTDDIQAAYRDNGASWDQLSAGLLEAALLKLYKGGVLTATRHGLNVIAGANVTITTADNPGLDATNVTIAAPPGSTQVRRTADKPLTNTITLQDDGQLFTALAANEVKAFRFVIFYDGSTAGDIAFGFSAPAGAAGTFGIVALQTAATTSTDSARFATQALVGGSVGAGCAGVGTKLKCILSGIAVNGATPGNLHLQWAQRVLDAVNATRVYADSHLVA